MNETDLVTWSQAWEVMKIPAATCLLLPPLLVYLGLHVVRREVIFVDLALAQVASFGACLAVFAGKLLDRKIDIHDDITFWISLAVTFVAAGLFSLTRSKRERRVPQEAIIGITFAVAAAGAIVLLSKVEGGKEEVQNLLVGDILNVQTNELMRRIILFGALGIFYFLLHKRFALISENPVQAYEQKLHVRLWDFLFYAAFGVMVVSFVRVAGVLLTFAYLIVPAVCGVMFATRWRTQLLIGWGIAVVASLLGLWSSFRFDLPTGAAIVCACGLLLTLVSIAAAFKNR